MLTKLSRFRKTLALLLTGMGTAVGVGLTTPAPAQAIPIGELLFRGVQLYQISNLSTKEKVALGGQIHQQVRQNDRLSTNSTVTRIGQRVARNSECSGVPFRFYVVENSSINAFATTGGYVYVHRGLLNALDNEDQLAAVLGHEIAHICNDDLIDKLRQAQIAQGAASLTGVDDSALASIAYQLAVDLPNSRDAEFDADADGVQYMRQAGYNPNATITFLRKLQQRRTQPTFLSTHPAVEDRIDVLQRRLTTNTQ